jgi:hypothetical protein
VVLNLGAFLKLVRVKAILNQRAWVSLTSKMQGGDLDVSQNWEEAEVSKNSYDVVCSFKYWSILQQFIVFIESSVEVLKEKLGKLIAGVPSGNPCLLMTNVSCVGYSLIMRVFGIEKSLKSLENFFFSVT